MEQTGLGYYSGGLVDQPAQLMRELDIVRDARRTFIDELLPSLRRRYEPVQV